ncbi:beta-N-acetylhexosaminidase [Desulfurivibrio alkaliphilus]|uniref:Glycoside hydrolase family 3 domain protein n=1 Tax=Desulfurivibrio alkaliphilus (strain DSM 19089 / UNIQEM U267 / AHT2) TaxID=589865 RepID=D6Z745_DESAT|nr:beta-N-acetylhexosaminidase [Desulfurivibrio alkaliphilus]ADH87032.1 glycoside hydrolase family 3 domain protein [Desulfurivibrio alkaliphilus AHT 2]
MNEATLPHPGGLFMVGLPGLALDDSTRELIVRERINDFILFKRNVESPAQLGRLTAALADACRTTGLGPPLISIDQEGGTVARLEPPFTVFPDARQLAAEPDPEAALTAYAETCAQELRSVGINMNMAPVLDLCPAGQGYYMERRVLGDDPAEVARLGQLIIEKMQHNGLIACGKHFPGLGAARLDPHREISAIERSRQELEQDLLPFRAAVEAGVAALMTSHTVYPALDPQRPATLSPLILADLLRRKLGYTGVVVTDDLEMGAIERQRGVPEAALAAFQAGADQLLICRDHDKVRRALARFKQALAGGEIAPARLRQSLARIAALRLLA